MTQLTGVMIKIQHLLAFRNMQVSPKDAYKANLLRIIIYVYFIGIGLLGLYATYGDMSNRWVMFLILVVMILSNIWCLRILKKGDTRNTSRIIIGLTWLIVAFGAYYSGGLYSSASLAIVILMVIATLLLDAKARFVVYLATLLYLFALLYIELTGNLPYAPFKDLPFRMSILVTVLTILFLIINYHLYAFRQSEDQNLSLKVGAERFRVQRELTQDLAHDLRTPLTTLRTSIYLIKKRQEKGLPIDETIQRLDNQTQQLNNLVEDLFQMTLLDKGEVEQTLNVIFYPDILTQSVEDAKQYAKTRNIKISFVNQFSQKRVIGNISQLKRAFDNLLENAIHYGQENGFIKIALSEEDGFLVIAIQDNGIGIAPENHEKVFERFYRIDAARTAREGQGSGVGLNAVQRILQLHGGHIKLESDLGKGSTFTVYLPIQK